MLLRLSAEEKVIGLGGLAVILSVFMPWYTTALLNNTVETETGFSGDLGVIGFVVFLLTLVSLGFLLGDHLHIRLPRFGFGKENIILFFSSENAFLLLIEVAIFTKRSLEFTNAEIRFGLYMALIGTILATFAAFAQLNRLQKKEAKAFFDHEPEPLEEATQEPQQEEEAIAEEPPAAKARGAKRHQVVNEGGRPVIQELFFEEEKTEQAPEEEIVTPLESEILAEETMTMAETPLDTELVEVEEVVETEIETGEAPEEKPMADGQGNYFLRDADIAPNVEIREVEKKEEAPSAPASRGNGFYDDL